MTGEKLIRIVVLAGGAAAVAFMVWYFFGPKGTEPEKRTPEEARDYWPDKVAPRHSGAVNVLFVDGSVAPRTPRQIDPRVARLNNEFWNPASCPQVPE